MTMRSELGESPEVVERLLASAKQPLRDIAKNIGRRSIRFVLIAARGSSDHAATYAQYVLGARNGLPVALAAPSLQSLYGASPDVRRALVIGISQSGRSPDIVAVLDDARRQGALTLAITNDPAAPLAEAAQLTVPLDAGPERAVAATKTYVAELAVVALLSASLAGEGSEPDLARLPGALHRSLELEPAIAALAQERSRWEACVVLGRGYHYATAREWALKLKEVAGVLADPYSAADFEHGPITLIEPSFPVLAIAVDGPAFCGMSDLLSRLRASGADLLVVSDRPEVRFIGASTIILEPGTPEWLTPLVAIVPCQLFAYHLALAAGRDPEQPRNLRKITLTR